MGRVITGSVHGRFQPFHNGHLDYVLQSFEEAEFVKIGLTQIFWPSSEEASRPRDNTDANPLAYWERALLIEAALVKAGVARNRFEFVPFPIETPETLRQFLSTSVLCFTTIVSDWNQEKIIILGEQGYSTKLLEVSQPDINRVTSGTEIRRLLRNGDKAWMNYVPAVVADLITEKFIDRF